MPLAPPALKHWRVGDVIGRGSCCTVWLAERPGSAPVAAKVIDLPQDVRPHTPAAARLEARLRRLQPIRHPALNILYEWAFSTCGTELWLILSLLHGASLDRSGRPAHFVQATASLAAGLAVCHEQGVLHGDIKPANLFVEPDGQPVLADFSLPLPPGDGCDFEPDDAPGSPGWLAPECFLGAPASAAADVYALGQVLIETAMGRPAFPPVGKGLAALLHLSDAKNRTPFLDPGETISDALRALLRRATARDPDARPTAAELADKASALASTHNAP
ncbi:MAG: serine/threonine protein kinase [Deltaproteobacteria bacterium]|nr:MAG: serine/threonine protein kinase [Deltaproteobacteria bacterium]